eukprot:scaffold68532_cov70-Phaeocystis_antarctica.AAC.6
MTYAQHRILLRRQSANAGRAACARSPRASPAPTTAARPHQRGAHACGASAATPTSVVRGACDRLRREVGSSYRCAQAPSSDYEETSSKSATAHPRLSSISPGQQLCEACTHWPLASTLLLPFVLLTPEKTGKQTPARAPPGADSAASTPRGSGAFAQDARDRQARARSQLRASSGPAASPLRLGCTPSRAGHRNRQPAPLVPMMSTRHQLHRLATDEGTLSAARPVRLCGTTRRPGRQAWLGRPVACSRAQRVWHGAGHRSGPGGG